MEMVPRRVKIKDGMIHGTESGEVMEFTGGELTLEIADSPKRKHRKAERHHRYWGLVDFAALRRLALNKLDMQIVLLVAESTDRDRGDARLSGAEMADILGVARNSVYRSLRSLRERRVLFGNAHVWTVSIHILTRGAVDLWEQETSKAMNSQPVWGDE